MNHHDDKVSQDRHGVCGEPRGRTQPAMVAEGVAGVGSNTPGPAPAQSPDEEFWWLRNCDRIYAAEQRRWNPRKFKEPREWKPRRRPPLEARNQGGFLDTDGSWCDARSLMEPEPNYGRRKRILSPSSKGPAWGPVGYSVEADLVSSGGLTIWEVREEKRAERRERLRKWLQVMLYVSPAWDSRGSGKKERNRTLRRYRKNSGRSKVVFFYAVWGLTQEEIAAQYGGLPGIPRSPKTVGAIIQDEERKMDNLLDKLDRVLDTLEHKNAMDALRWQQLFQTLREGTDDDKDAGPDLYLIEGQN
jgi:hypothetical protein